jgi:isopenicillin N synthase-like dioxygenase
MAALGLGLSKHALSDKIINGGFYMSPTGIDLLKSTPGQLLTAFHRDFDLLTVHGKARYAGLYAWLLTGEKFLVQVPEGHLLVQGGKQLEWLTGGYIKAGFHEVVHNELVE